MGLFDSIVGVAVGITEELAPGLTVVLFKKLLIHGPQSGLKKLVGAMAVEMKEGLRDGKTDEVEKLAKVGVDALSVSLDNSGYAFASDLAAIAVDLLKDAIDKDDIIVANHLSEAFVGGLDKAADKHYDDVVRLIDERREEFNEAVRTPVKGLAVTLSAAAVMLLLVSVEQGKKRLEDILSRSWVKALTEAAGTTRSS